MEDLLPRATRLGELLKRRAETVAVTESSAGGLVSAALLAIPGASAYFMGSGPAALFSPSRRRRWRAFARPPNPMPCC